MKDDIDHFFEGTLGEPHARCTRCGESREMHDTKYGSIREAAAPVDTLRSRIADLEIRISELLRRTEIAESAVTDIRYRELIPLIAQEDVDRLLKKDQEYGASWKRRGGVGAYFTMIRKFDRMQSMIPGQKGYDIFAHLLDETGTDGSTPTESLLDTIRDARGYLTLIEAEHRVRIGETPQQPPDVEF